MESIFGKMSLGLTGAMLMLGVAGEIAAQNPPGKSSEPHQMILTKNGLIAIDVPKGWVQSDGPGLAFFLPEGVDADKTLACIYISSAPVGPNEEDKDVESYIQSDISGYKQRFKNAVVNREANLILLATKLSASVFTFRSGEQHNAFEQVVYIPDAGRVLLLTFSAKNADAFNESMTVFHEFAKTYRGSIQEGTPEK